MGRRHLAVALGVGLWASCEPGPVLPPDATAPVRVGALLPLTGGLNAVGAYLRDAIRLVEHEANAAGGIRGRPVQFVIEDSGTDGEKARLATARLLETGVVALLGPAASSEAALSMPIAQAAKVPQVSCCATAESLTRTDAGEDHYFFRTAPSDANQAALVGGLAADRFGCQALGILYIDDPYGAPFAASVRAAYLAATVTGEIVAEIPFVDERAAYVDEATQMRDAAPDCIALVAFYKSGGRILRDWNGLAGTPLVTWIGTDGVRTLDFITEAGDPNFVDGVVGTAPITSPQTAQNQAFLLNFETTFGSLPDVFGNNQYDAAALMVLALQRTGGAGGQDLRDALTLVSSPGDDATEKNFGPGELQLAFVELSGGRDVNYEGASGNVDFDPFGDVDGIYELWRYDADAADFVRDDTLTGGAP